ncbi:MAG: 5-bromo-4-chloroindolyl phosphate hydrolysis family protein [Campylobacterota bacterium]|nr:5-bromo-4-chloroindolyl phosphate hydrolysis family protein [Campylobacterota bacterium]
MSKAKKYNPASAVQKSKKGTLLYLFLIPLFLAVILALLQMNIKAFLLNSLMFALFFLSAKLTTKGFEQEFVYHEETFTKAPEVPYKTIAALLLGSSTFLSAWFIAEKSFVSALFLGAISLLGYYWYYGFDPKEDKFENLGDISAEFVLKTMHEAKIKLANIEEHMYKVEDVTLSNKLDKAVNKAKSILKTLQEDPKDIRVARKFLIVYLDGVSKVMDSYDAMDEVDVKHETKEKLYRLMDDLEIRFDKELVRLKNNNQFDLDVHIDVLKEQIKN